MTGTDAPGGGHDWEDRQRGSHKTPWTRRCKACGRKRIDAQDAEGRDIGVELGADGVWRREAGPCSRPQPEDGATEPPTQQRGA